MSKGTQLWPGDKMRSFFSAYIRRETSLDGAAADRLAASLTKAVNRMLVWEMPDGPAGGSGRQDDRDRSGSRKAARAGGEFQSISLLGDRRACQTGPRRADQTAAGDQVSGRICGRSPKRSTFRLMQN